MFYACPLQDPSLASVPKWLASAPQTATVSPANEGLGDADDDIHMLSNLGDSDGDESWEPVSVLYPNK